MEDDTYNELIEQWQKEKQEISNKIANLSESTKNTITRMNLLIDFANRIPELYLKATLDEKRMILATITESITIDGESEIITVKLRPVFEQLRLTKQSFNANLENLYGTLENHSTQEEQTSQKINSNVSYISNYGTRKSTLNTKIEPNFDDSKKSNVDGGT